MLIAKDLSLLFNNDNYFVGWVLKNPLEKIVSDFSDVIEAEMIDDDIYEVFNTFFNLHSDEQLELFDDDIEQEVRFLVDEINRGKFHDIANSKAKVLLKNAIDELQDFYLSS